VPTIDDDGFVLWESHTIVRYLAAKHGMGRLCPSELRARADAERWMDWAFTFQRAMRDVFWGLIRTPPEKRDAKAIEDGRVASNKLAAEVLERSLERKAYVTGDAFTMGDIPIGCEIQRWMRVAIERPKLPNVEAWFERLRARPAYQKFVDIPLS
jgi:glutathione S-transferase